MNRVVITGLGAITPLGNDIPSFWNGLIAGKSGAAPITNFDASKFKTRFACEVKDFDPIEIFGRKEARKLDAFCQFALVAADEAIKDAGITPESGLNFDRIGVIFSSGIGGLNVIEEEITNYAVGNGDPRFNPFFIPKMIADMGAGQISIKYGFRGINYATVSACSSSTHAIMDAANYIRLGKADLIITGGSEASVTAIGVGGFGAMKALSTFNEDPQKASRPFDQNRDGFVLGEGAGALVLENLDQALKRGATIYAEVIGSGASADAYHLTATHPEGLGAILGMKAALEDASLTVEDIDYLNVHATSTPVGDTSEIRAITNLFGDHVVNLDISATKSMTGHLLGAAGAVEAIACIMSIKHNKIPPTINLEKRDSEISPDLKLTPNHSIEKEVKIAMSNTFGFGGHNAIGIFKEYVN